MRSIIIDDQFSLILKALMYPVETSAIQCTAQTPTKS